LGTLSPQPPKCLTTWLNKRRKHIRGMCPPGTARATVDNRRPVSDHRDRDVSTLSRLCRRCCDLSVLLVRAAISSRRSRRTPAVRARWRRRVARRRPVQALDPTLRRRIDLLEPVRNAGRPHTRGCGLMLACSGSVRTVDGNHAWVAVGCTAPMREGLRRFAGVCVDDAATASSLRSAAVPASPGSVTRKRRCASS
jgi:hypothetical protein